MNHNKLLILNDLPHYLFILVLITHVKSVSLIDIDEGLVLSVKLVVTLHFADFEIIPKTFIRNKRAPILSEQVFVHLLTQLYCLTKITNCLSKDVTTK